MKPIGLHRAQGDFSRKYRRASRTREKSAMAREHSPDEFEGIDETIAYEVQDAEEDPATVMPGKPRFGTYHGG